MAVVTQEEIMAFRMPTPRQGEVVAWYPTGQRSRESEVAHVYRVAGRNVHLVTATKGVKEAVRHVDDPKLRLNSDQREMGAWDFTEATQEDRKKIAALETSVKQLRQQITALITDTQKKKAKPAGKGLKQYQELRNKALEAGVEFKGNPPRQWLEEQVHSKEHAEAS